MKLVSFILKVLTPNFPELPLHFPAISPGGVLPEKLGGVCGPVPKTLTLFQT